MGMYEQAETAARIYLSRDPESSYAHSLLGNIYLALGEKAEAEQEFTRAGK
jgi:Flp pilus assembly protein TadD